MSMSELRSVLKVGICLNELCVLLITPILHWYREVPCDEVEQLCPFPLLTGCVWHQYFQWHQDVNLGYDLQKI